MRKYIFTFLIAAIMAAGIVSMAAAEENTMKIAAFYENIYEGAMAAGKDMEEVLTGLKEAGMDLIYISVDYWEKDCEELAPLLAKLDIGIEGMYGWCYFSGNPDREDYKEMIDLAAQAGADNLLIVPGMITMPGSKKKVNSQQAIDNIVAGMRKAVTYGEEKGISVLMEDYDDLASPYSSIAGMNYFMDQIEGLGCAFDTGNFVIYHEDEYEAFETFANKIRTVHLKDRSNEPPHPGGYSAVTVDQTESWTCVLGSGDLEIQEILEGLAANGYKGNVIVEMYGVGSDYMLEDIYSSINWLKSLNLFQPVAENGAEALNEEMDRTMKQDASRVKFGIAIYNFVVGKDLRAIDSMDGLKDLLQEIAAAGYDGVEWYQGKLDDPYMDLQALKEIMDELNLESTSLQFVFRSMDTLKEDAENAIETCLALGTDRLVISTFPGYFGITADDDGKWTAEQIDSWAENANAMIHMMQEAAQGTGVQILYHNHNTEFLPCSDGRYALDHIVADGKQIDIYWAAKGLDGVLSEAVDYVNTNIDDVYLMHIKDGTDGSSAINDISSWGAGDYDIQSVINIARGCEHVEWVIAENDLPKGSGLEDAKRTAAYAATHLVFVR